MAQGSTDSSSEGNALRVGLIGTPSEALLAVALQRIAASLPAFVTPPNLRLLHAAGSSPGVPPGWTGCPVAGARDDVADTIVHNADVLIVADGADASVVAAALRLEAPVLCLSDGRARLLTDRFWAVSVDKAAEGEAAWAALGRRVAAMLATPDGPVPETLQAIEAQRRLPDRALWRAHRAALALLAREPAGADRGGTASLHWWSGLYSSADALATAYADRYRSSYTIVLALAAVALIAAVLGLRVEYHWTVGLIEALCLAGIVALVWANTRLDWRSRLIQARLLAELCRKQAALAFVGRSLPAGRIAGLTRDGGLDWIGWRFAAAVRAAPLPGAAGASLGASRDAAAAVLLQGQRAYHEARVRLGRRREKRLVQAGGWVFGLTALFVVVKLGLLFGRAPEASEDAGLVAAVLPAVAAALFGFRAYAELELMVQQSEHLVTVLSDAEANLARIDPAAAGAGQAIGDVLEETAVEMLADVGGWIQISRVKAVEAG